MERLRTPAARLLLAMGMLAWMAVTWADQLHTYLVVHAVCPDHGEIVELAHGDERAVATTHDGPSVGDAHGEDAHDHGCASLLCQIEGLPALKVAPAPVGAKPVATSGFWSTTAPRGPPLAWAPKTSPPRAS